MKDQIADSTVEFARLELQRCRIPLLEMDLAFCPGDVRVVFAYAFGIFLVPAPVINARDFDFRMLPGEFHCQHTIA